MLAELGMESGQEFGDGDEDWDVYREVQKFASEDEGEEEL